MYMVQQSHLKFKENIMVKLSIAENFTAGKLWLRENLQLKWNLKHSSLTTPKLTNFWLYSSARILNDIRERVKMCSNHITTVTLESYHTLFNIYLYLQYIKNYVNYHSSLPKIKASSCIQCVYEHARFLKYL